MSELLAVSIVLSTAVALTIYYFGHKSRDVLPYPPGPKAAYPIVGNILDVPKDFQWLTYTEWGKLYGDIVHISILGEHLIIINSQEVANELLEKRSGNYSDRPDIPIMHMNGWDIHMGLKHYTNEWRRDRRILHQRFRREAAPNLYPLEVAKSQALLHQLLLAPEDYVSHFQLYPASIIMYLLYGHEVTSRHDPLVNLTFETIEMFSGSAFPGTNFLNIFPALRHLPAWFPGLRDLHRLCAECRHLLRKMQDIPFDSVKKHVAEETAVPSLVSELLEKNGAKGEENIPEDVIKSLGASMFSAAMETTSAFLTTFVLAMVLYPEVQDRAQAEIDSVIGNNRLPSFEDRASLPYIDALVRELFRWHGPTPLGIPHAALQDDVYNGFYIPKGATIIANTWAMWRDERVFQKAEEFRPERFLSTDGDSLTDQFPPTFGFGRRACVGKSMADASTWIALVSILSVFRMEKSKDQLGNLIEVSEKFGDGAVSAPLPFKCSITPRSETAKKLILGSPPMKLSSNPMFY